MSINAAQVHKGVIDVLVNFIAREFDFCCDFLCGICGKLHELQAHTLGAIPVQKMPRLYRMRKNRTHQHYLVIMKNTLTDLNNHLFAQLERISEEDITDERLIIESGRTKDITMLAKEIINNARLVLDAQTRICDIPERKELPAMLQ